MAYEQDVVDEYRPMLKIKLSADKKEQLWSRIAERIARNDKVALPVPRQKWLGTTMAGVAAVVIVGLGTYALTHDSKVQNVTTAHHQQSWNSTYWTSTNPNFLSPELLRVNKSSLIVRVVGGNISGGEKNESIELTPETTTWSNGKMVPFILSASSLKSGDNFTVITEENGKHLVAKQIYAPDSQVYGIVQGVSGDVVTVKELSQTNFKNYTGRILKLKFDRRTTFNGASPAELKRGYMVQSQVTGRYPGMMLMYGVEITKGKKLPNGVMQWSSVSSKAT